MKFSIDHKSRISLHIQAEELLRTMISDPEHLRGKFLPNVVELAEQLAISRSTLRQTLNKLVYEGLLIRKKGVGTKVAETAMYDILEKDFSVVATLSKEKIGGIAADIRG